MSERSLLRHRTGSFRASRGDPRGADPKDSQEPRRRENRDHPFAFVPQGKNQAEGVEPEQVPAPTPRSHAGRTPRETRAFVESPAQEFALPGRGRTHPPERAGRTAPGKEGPPACGPRNARPLDEQPQKADDERSGVATPGAPASAGTSKVRRAGGLRGPHATTSEPASEGRARRQLQARTEDGGGTAGSTTTRTEDRETGPSE
jgi:hypothetical protein